MQHNWHHLSRAKKQFNRVNFPLNRVERAQQRIFNPRQLVGLFVIDSTSESSNRVFPTDRFHRHDRSAITKRTERFALQANARDYRTC